MGGYWVRHRLAGSLLISCAVALMAGLLFAYPYIRQRAEDYNTQSVYRNSEMDFIAPEPSFEQVEELAGTHGIDKIFPYFLTKTQVSANGTDRATTVLLTDQMENVAITMYNESRLIEKVATDQTDHLVYIDWQFAKDTGTSPGDSISIPINGKDVSYTVAAVYETNSIYEDGAILADITEEEKDQISQNAANNGYSGMYLSASDYDTCKAYLTTDYRPLGRLKDETQFDSKEQYQIHYDAIMSSSYANEITDFRQMESDATDGVSIVLLIIGAVLSAVILFVFDYVMANRGVEKVYFTKSSIPKGQNVLPYYNTTFAFETIMTIVLFGLTLATGIHFTDIYIPGSAFSPLVILIPVAILVSELVSLKTTQSKIKEIEERIREEQERKRREQDEQAGKTVTTVKDTKQ